MNIIKCDKCKRIKKENYPSLSSKSKWVRVSIWGKGEWFDSDLCGKCGEDVVRYIKKYLKVHEQKRK